MPMAMTCWKVESHAHPAHTFRSQDDSRAHSTSVTSSNKQRSCESLSSVLMPSDEVNRSNKAAPERVDVARPAEVGGRGGRVGQQPQRARAVLRADSRAYALPRIHRHLRTAPKSCDALHSTCIQQHLIWQDRPDDSQDVLDYSS